MIASNSSHAHQVAFPRTRKKRQAVGDALRMASSAPSSDPACDQCRLKKVRCGREQPECVNCRRNGISCTFSERGKKSNQMGQVIHSLKEMKSRLDDIDHTILQVKTVVDGATAKSSSLDQDASSVAMCMTDAANGAARNNKSDDNSALATTHYLVNDQHYGTSSLASLFNEIEEFLEASLTDRKNSVGTNGSTSPVESLQECQLALHKTAKTLMFHDSLDLPGEDLPPTLPPQEVLEATVESYFGQVNSMLPIFRKGAFCENVRRIYSTVPDQADIAWILCFNNIILQTLSTDPIQHPEESEESHMAQRKSPEKELLQPLLVNYRRGLKKIDRLLEPKLVNVQALLSMCMIAQESFHYRLASLLLHHACFVAKSMGLHQQNTISSDHTSEKTLEHNHTFWVLYIIDKTISLTMGQSCCLPMYDCDVSSPNNDPSSPFHEHFVARVELAAMQEDSYQMLYSSQARRHGDLGKSNSISRMDHKLALGATRHGALREDIRDNSGTASPSHSMHSYASMALGYHFYMTRVLVHRAVKRTSDQRQCCRDSRACIQLLQRLNVDYIPGACAVWRQIYGDHPLIPFFVLFSNVIQEPHCEQSIQDVQLMATAASTLQHSQRLESSRACVAQLISCSQAVTALVSTSTVPTTLSSMMSSTTAFKEPLTINTDPFHTYTELTGRKRNKLNATSRSSSWTNISASARSHRVPAEYTPLSEQDLSRPENWNYDFANPVEMTLPGGGLSLEYESPSLLSMHRPGLEPSITGPLDEHHQQHMDNSQVNVTWSEDSGVYEMAMGPQIGTKWPVEFGTGYFGDEYGPRRTEQWLG